MKKTRVNGKDDSNMSELQISNDDMNQGMLMCPSCRTLVPESILHEETGTCPECKREFYRENGFLAFVPRDELDNGYASMYDDIYFIEQEDETTTKRFERYFIPLFSELQIKPKARILCLGCGGGADVTTLRKAGFRNAVGVDMGWRTQWWQFKKRDPATLYLADGRVLPFADATFDLIICLGVIEHVGAVGSTAELCPDYAQQRILFLSEATRILSSNGQMILACPNQTFPVDFQHNISRWPILKKIAVKTGISVHSPWSQFLPSYGIVKRYLLAISKDFIIVPMRVHNYLGLSFRNSPILRPLGGIFDFYLYLLDRFPPMLRMSGLNPYLILSIKRKSS